jgi:hypothetical protein
MSGEVNMEEFYVQMGYLIKRRDNARAAVEKWQAKQAEYERMIEELVQTQKPQEVEAELNQEEVL